MSIAKITMIGFENWLNNENKSLFDSLVLPEGIDKETLCNNILLTGGEFEVLYSNPYSMRKYIQLWSNKYSRTFEKWIKALNVEYNPLENYDRMEEWEDTSAAHTESVGKVTSSSDSDFLDKVNTYDDDTFHDRGKQINSLDSESDQTASNNANSNNKHSGRMHGNIGVTTSQQMLQSELDIARWNIYEHITDLFLQEFCILVYE